MAKQVRTTCNRDCPDACGIIATIENGRITRHEGDPEHGITRGFLCHRGNHYSSERVLFPQRRTSAGWQQISWDDALDMVAERLIRARVDKTSATQNQWSR